MEALIDVQNAWVRHGDYEILKGVSVSFPTGEASFILGPSGCGKSSLLKVAAGLIPVDEGDVLVGNKSWSRMSDEETREFRLYGSYVFQDSALWANLSIFQNMMLPLQYHFPSMSLEARKKRVDTVLAQVGYSESLALRPSDLSAGEQKLVGFARALVIDPLLLFLDTPLSLVDGHNATRLVEFCREYRRQKRSMIIVTNKLEFCLEMADRIVIMNQGRIEASGELFDVVERWPAIMGKLNKGHLAILEQRREQQKPEIFS